jgi:predicted DNA-binding transcriptional regulator AlpA
MADHELILEPECRELTRLHPTTRWRLQRRNKFPHSFKIGDPDAINGRKAWSRSEIMEWIAARKAARKTENTAQMSALTEPPKRQCKAT